MIYLVTFLMGFMLVGHLVFGFDWYIKPVLLKELDVEVKATTKSVFHYITVMLGLSFIYVLLVAIGKFELNSQLTTFIGIFYILGGIINISYMFKDRVAFMRMFQWTLFLTIGILTVLL